MTKSTTPCGPPASQGPRHRLSNSLPGSASREIIATARREDVLPLSLALVVHAHQPIGNFEHVFEDAYQTSYRPFLEHVARFPHLCVTLHYSGILLDWISRHHPEYLGQLRDLIAAHRVEILGGGYFEPILAAIPERDQVEQVQRLNRCVQHHLGVVPQGAWLTERVWEPNLPKTLAAAGLTYGVLDDTHFLLAGRQADELTGDFITEHEGAPLRLVPSNHYLRHVIPFRPEEEALGFLLQQARLPGDRLLAVGDDLEKFGTWPHTFQHVYQDGWLQRFFAALEDHAAAITTVTLGSYLQLHPPLGRVYLPTASYPEMMQWALPAALQRELQAARAASEGRPASRFLMGAPWKSFLSRYEEANWMHKTTLALSDRLAALPRSEAAGARDHLLAAQCNDAYWHGLFGGLYAPHLRDAVYSQLLAADRLLDTTDPKPAVELVDLNLDLRLEAVLRTRVLRAVVCPADGGTIAELSFRPRDANLINALRRRVEAYHAQIRDHLGPHNPAQLPGPATVGAASEFERLLRYDRYARTCGRLYLLPSTATFHDYLALQADEEPQAAGGEYQLRVAHTGTAAAELIRSVTWKGQEIEIAKHVRLDDTVGAAGQLEIVTRLDPVPAACRAGLEMVLNFLAPTAPDRAVIFAGERHPLSFEGEFGPGSLYLEDGWRGVRVTLDAPGASGWWITPIFTVSQCEAGFEKVYQGSAILAHWPCGSVAMCVQLKVEALPATP